MMITQIFFMPSRISACHISIAPLVKNAFMFPFAMGAY